MAETALEVGTRAPAFNLPNQTGQHVRLSSLKGKKVFLYFYPKAMTPGCNTQAEGLRDIKDQIGNSTIIIGISPDPPLRLDKFDQKFDLGFTLVSDESTETAQKYGVWVKKKNRGKEHMGVQRSAFLVDEKGKISHAWPKITPKETPNALLGALGKKLVEEDESDQ